MRVRDMLAAVTTRADFTAAQARAIEVGMKAETVWLYASPEARAFLVAGGFGWAGADGEFINPATTHDVAPGSRKVARRIKRARVRAIKAREHDLQDAVRAEVPPAVKVARLDAVIAQVKALIAAAK